MVILCNDVSHKLGANLESALCFYSNSMYIFIHFVYNVEWHCCTLNKPWQLKRKFVPENNETLEDFSVRWVSGISCMAKAHCIEIMKVVILRYTESPHIRSLGTLPCQITRSTQRVFHLWCDYPKGLMQKTLESVFWLLWECGGEKRGIRSKTRPYYVYIYIYICVYIYIFTCKAILDYRKCHILMSNRKWVIQIKDVLLYNSIF